MLILTTEIMLVWLQFTILVNLLSGSCYLKFEVILVHFSSEFPVDALGLLCRQVREREREREKYEILFIRNCFQIAQIQR